MYMMKIPLMKNYIKKLEFKLLITYFKDIIVQCLHMVKLVQVKLIQFKVMEKKILVCVIEH